MSPGQFSYRVESSDSSVGDASGAASRYLRHMQLRVNDIGNVEFRAEQQFDREGRQVSNNTESFTFDNLNRLTGALAGTATIQYGFGTGLSRLVEVRHKGNFQERAVFLGAVTIRQKTVTSLVNTKDVFQTQ